MRLKLTIASATLLAVVLGAAAQAAPVPIAVFDFATKSQVTSFQREVGAKCQRQWRRNRALGVKVGKATGACYYRSSVLADSADPGPDQQLKAAANVAPVTPEALQKRIFVSVSVRASDNQRYELRVFPGQQKAQLVRDPRGSAGPQVLRVVKGKFVKPGFARNLLLLRAFDFGTPTVRLLARVNKGVVFSGVDTRPGSPNGRRNEVGVASPSGKPIPGALGVFDDVLVSVPNPF